ncbi:MAG: oligosaccharide flippase family protein [Candidatus Beckwithbacteria bacterium]|nr:oligosaccharide flippase family protein [Candidatus Beckwithbacteria bacterium]
MKQFFSSQTIKDSTVVTIGMGISTVLSALSIFFIARFLGPSGFGLYVSALAVVVIITDSLELAISNSLVKFAAGTDRPRAFIKFGFYLKLFLGLVLGLLFTFASQPLATLIQPQLKTPLLVASGIIPAVFLLRFPRSVLQAQKRFISDSVIDVSTNLLRLLFILSFYYFFHLTVELALVAYVLGALTAFLVGASLISWRFLASPLDVSVKRKFFNFQKWLTLGFIVAAIHGRIDSILLLRFSGPSATGIYQAAYRFFMPAIQLAAALSLVFAPRFASFDTGKKTRQYLTKATILSLSLACLSLAIIPLSPWLVNLIFGQKYNLSIPLVRILAFGFAAFLAGAPFTSHLIYSTHRTKLFLLINLCQLILLITLDFILMPLYGSYGAAWAITVTLVIINSVLALLAWTYVKKN